MKPHHPNNATLDEPHPIGGLPDGSYARLPSVPGNEDEDEEPDLLEPVLARNRTQRPIKGHCVTCKFGFRVYWSSANSRWFLPKKQGGCSFHSDHPAMEVNQIRIQLRMIGEKECELARQTLSQQIAASQITGVVDARTGIALETQQLYHLNRKRAQENIDLDLAAVLRGDDAPGGNRSSFTAAEKLIAAMSNKADHSFVVLFGEYDDDRLTIRQTFKRLHQEPIMSDIDPSELQDPIDSAATFASKVRESLHIRGSGQILLGVAWTTDEMQRLYSLFPEFMCSDVTHKSNQEKRPLLLVCGKDSSNRSFAHTSAFLPSEAKWSFVVL